LARKKIEVTLTFTKSDEAQPTNILKNLKNLPGKSNQKLKFWQKES